MGRTWGVGLEEGLVCGSAGAQGENQNATPWPSTHTEGPAHACSYTRRIEGQAGQPVCTGLVGAGKQFTHLIKQRPERWPSDPESWLRLLLRWHLGVTVLGAPPTTPSS